jgi:hypothetical protein
LIVSSSRAISARAATKLGILAAARPHPGRDCAKRAQRARARDPPDPHDRRRVDVPALSRWRRVVSPDTSSSQNCSFYSAVSVRLRFRSDLPSCCCSDMLLLGRT